MANMTLTKAREIVKAVNNGTASDTYTDQEIKSAKAKVESPTEDKKMAKGGMAKDKVTVVSIGIGTMSKKDAKKLGKPKMADGGMAYGKKHMYAAGGSVTMNPGLKALKKASPEAFNKITGK